MALQLLSIGLQSRCLQCDKFINSSIKYVYTMHRCRDNRTRLPNVSQSPAFRDRYWAGGTPVSAVYLRWGRRQDSRIDNLRVYISRKRLIIQRTPIARAHHRENKRTNSTAVFRTRLRQVRACLNSHQRAWEQAGRNEAVRGHSFRYLKKRVWVHAETWASPAEQRIGTNGIF